MNRGILQNLKLQNDVHTITTPIKTPAKISCPVSDLLCKILLSFYKQQHTTHNLTDCLPVEVDKSNEVI
jgi:hypothetical protein